MGAREIFYQYHGPKMYEAIMQTIHDEINALRQELGLSKLPEKHKDDNIKALEAKIQSMANYEGMKVFVEASAVRARSGASNH